MCSTSVCPFVCLSSCLSPCPSLSVSLPSAQALTRELVLQQLTAQFAKEYEERTGQAVKFRLSFGGSGTQARAVVDGLPGDMGQSPPPSPPLPPLPFSPRCLRLHFNPSAPPSSHYPPPHAPVSSMTGMADERGMWTLLESRHLKPA